MAHLSRLKLSDDEIGAMTTDLSAVLDHFDKLKELDTSKVEPMSHPGDLSSVFREDVNAPSLSPEDALKNAPEQAQGFFRVPRVIE